MKINHYVYSNPEEFNAIREQTRFPRFIYEDLLDEEEVAHIRWFELGFCGILNYPYHSAQGIKNLPFVITVNSEEVAVIHSALLDLDAILVRIKANQPATFFCRFLGELYRLYGANLKEISEHINESETKMMQATDREQIQALFTLKKNLIQLQVGITGLGEVVANIIENKPLYIWADFLIDEYKDIKIEDHQLDKTIAMTNEIISAILDVSSSLQANRLNQTMKSLTAITLVISVPTLITSFYGMNINLPFQNHPLSLLIVSLSSFVITVLVVVTMFRKNWL